VRSSRILPDLLAMGDWQSRAVWRRNATVYFRNWKTGLLPPTLEPVVYFLALGIGLGGYVGALTYGGEAIDYATYVAPGLLAYTAFGTPFYEALYSSYVRMFYQKTWDGILATQVELRHIVWGEILWAGTRGFVNTALVAVTLSIFALLGIVHIQVGWLLLAPVLGLVAGWAFASFGLIFTAIVPSIDHMNYPVFLIGVPLSLVSNTYFPLESDHPLGQFLIGLNPVYQLAEAIREALVHGRLGIHVPLLLATSAFFLAVLVAVGQPLTERRVLGPS